MICPTPQETTSVFRNINDFAPYPDNLKIKHSVEIKKRLGIAAQEAYFDHYLSIKDNLIYHGLLYGLPRKELKKKG